MPNNVTVTVEWQTLSFRWCECLWSNRRKEFCCIFRVNFSQEIRWACIRPPDRWMSIGFSTDWLKWFTKCCLDLPITAISLDRPTGIQQCHCHRLQTIRKRGNRTNTEFLYCLKFASMKHFPLWMRPHTAHFTIDYQSKYTNWNSFQRSNLLRSHHWTKGVCCIIASTAMVGLHWKSLPTLDFALLMDQVT